MLLEEQKSGHRRIIPENNPSLSDNIQDASCLCEETKWRF